MGLLKFGMILEELYRLWSSWSCQGLLLPSAMKFKVLNR